MSIREEAHIKGSVHDVVKLAALSGDDCHILFVSSRTLYILANYAMGEVDYLGRYAKDIFDGGLVDVVDGGDTEEEFVREVANQFGLEVIPVCEDLIPSIEQISIQLGLINGSIQAAGILDGCCVPVGSNPEAPAPTLGDPEVDDPPEDWGDWATYNTYKCRAANKIADDWITTLSNLATLSGAVAAIGALALGAFFSTSLLSGILVGLMILGFSAFTAAAIIIGALVLIVLGGVGLLAYFADLGQDISDTKEDLVCQLYDAQSPAAAKVVVVDFTLDVAALIDYDPGDDDTLFQAQLSAIVDALFNESVTNKLFELDDEIDTYVGDIDCVVCEPGEGIIWQTGTSSPHNVIEIGAYTDIWPSSWNNEGDAYDDADGWNDDDDSSYPDTRFHIINPAYGTDWANNDPVFDEYWVTVRIEFTGYNGAWRLRYEDGFDEQSPTHGPGYSGGYYRSGKDASLDTWEEVVAGLVIADEYLQISVGHGGDTSTSSGKGSFRIASLQITNDIYP